MNVRQHVLSACITVYAVALAVGAEKSASFEGQEMNGGNFEGRNLENASFQNATIRGASFNRADLTGANFRGAKLVNVKFHETDLTKADFRDATMEFTTFDDAKLQDANLQGLDLSSVSLNNCDLRGADLRYVTGIGDATGALFNGADLRHADLRELTNSPVEKPVFRRARYDGKTRWPSDVDPEDVGALRDQEAAPRPASNASTTAIVPAQSPDARPVELPQPVRGLRQFDGLYWIKGIDRACNVYYFTSEGYFCDTPIGGTKVVDVVAAAKARPWMTGSYVVKQNAICFQFANRKSDTQSFRVDGDKLIFNEGELVRAEPFEVDAKLSGTFEGNRVASISTPEQSAVQVLRKYAFTSEGEFALESAGLYASAVDIVPGVDSERAGMPLGVVRSKGTYILGGNTLTLRSTNGKIVNLTIFSFRDANQTPSLYIDGFHCKQTR